MGILPPAEVLVLDFDDPATWDGLRAEYPELAEAPRQRTPRGGVHVFLRLPESLVGSLTTSARKLPGLDLRGMGKAYLAASPTSYRRGPIAGKYPCCPRLNCPPYRKGCYSGCCHPHPHHPGRSG
ncbi:bifunctional DNA primase/polymerase [Meiothermus sp.]|uniref:bifunctional DNA primase/polymerase n=1 Tax=Meiothermus sp. TaxID=1955249 RepID=UPI0021DBD6D3|nr:bifunctional DNA primase/polymerase [Meiothermus sp.]GIW24751.1 MAG: hypothetical protein KatS3mg069_1018 [Meiothermus sp.]